MMIYKFNRLAALVFLATLGLLSVNSMFAENIKIEVIFDNDKGFGKGEIYKADVGNNNISIPLGGLANGAHLVSFRAQDSEGRWSTTITRPFLVFEASGIDRAECYIDNDPGKGNGTPVTVSDGSHISFSIPTAGLSTGVHTLTFRIMVDGNWSESMSKTFLVTSDLMIYEWFFDNDPGVGKGNQKEATTGENIFMLPTDELKPGAHTFSSRVKNAAGHWSHTITRPIYVTEKIEDIISAEYYIDTDPGINSGNAVTLDDDGRASFVVPTANLSIGSHYLTLRGKGKSGAWYEIFSSPFEVTNFTGIESVEWKMNFIANRVGKNVVLISNDIPAESVVQITGLNGIVYYRNTWENTMDNLNIPITSPERIIITVTDKNGKRATRIL